MSDLSAYTDCLNLADSKMVLAYLRKPGTKGGWDEWSGEGGADVEFKEKTSQGITWLRSDCQIFVPVLVLAPIKRSEVKVSLVELTFLEGTTGCHQNMVVIPTLGFGLWIQY
jgi:hypothetical protein